MKPRLGRIQLYVLAVNLVLTKDDPQTVTKKKMHGYEFVEEDIGRLKREVGLFRCKKCGTWRGRSSEQFYRNNQCVKC